jgi:hypothetical protein
MKYTTGTKYICGIKNFDAKKFSIETGIRPISYLLPAIIQFMSMQRTKVHSHVLHFFRK